MLSISCQEPTLCSAVKLAAVLGVGVEVFAGCVNAAGTEKPAAPRPAAKGKRWGKK